MKTLYRVEKIKLDVLISLGYLYWLTCATFILGNLVCGFSDLTTPPYDATDNQLIGTSKERSLLNNEINASYQRSLQIDEDKEKEKITDEKIANRRIVLMNERKKTVPDEPNFGGDIAVIKIRHPLLGTKTCFFNGYSHENPHTFTQIYDWVGSLSQTPEHFYIVDYSGKRISPEKKVFSGTFNVEENETLVLMSPEGVVAFRGYSTSRIIEKHLKTQNMNHSKQTITFALEKLKQMD